MDTNFEKIQRDYLREQLKLCTEGQINLFNRMYKSIDEIPVEKMDWAVFQIERAIKKNESQANVS